MASENPFIYAIALILAFMATTIIILAFIAIIILPFVILYKAIKKNSFQKRNTKIYKFDNNLQNGRFSGQMHISKEPEYIPKWEKVILNDGTEFYRLLNPKNNTNNMPYSKKNILTNTEYAFWLILKEKCAPHGIIICPKVRMEDFIDVTASDYRTKQSFRGKIKSRHIDFMLCDKNLNTLAGLELDDNSHLRNDRKEVDEFKNQVFNRIDIPLYRVIVNQGNYHGQIQGILNELLTSNQKVSQ